MSLLNKLLSQSKKAELGHDIHENCAITEVSITGKPDKDGNASKWNCVTKFAKYNTEDKIIGEKEVQWYNLDHSNEYVRSKFSTQILQIVNILECFISPEEVNALIDPILADFDITDEETLQDVLSDRDNCKNIMEDIAKAYVKEMVKHLNSDKKVRLKLSFDSKGKYVGAPMYNELVESMSIPKDESKLKFSKTEQENELKSKNLSAVTDKPTKKLSSI